MNVYPHVYPTDTTGEMNWRKSLIELVGAPRFELGTPCTPCKCATRLRHAPTRLLFFYEDLSPRLGNWPRALANHTLFGDSGAAASAPQDSHQLLELNPHLLDDLLTLRHVRASLLPLELVART